MSLHNLASHVQGAGRGEDKVLVHMTPGEVNGLQSLAMAHGGSLTINPQTGLPEAGFLSSLLPMAIGFGLAPFTGGLSSALITGAGYTAATGSLKKGIMAGLGAYGGAGLAGGLNAMGAQAAGQGVNVANAGKIGLQASPNVLGATANVADDVALANFRTLGTNTGAGLSTSAGLNPAAASNMGLNANYAGGMQLNAMAPSASTVSTFPPAAPARVLDSTTTQQFARGMQPAPVASTAVPTQSISRPYTDYMGQVGQGAKKAYAGGIQGLKDLYAAMPEYSVAAGLGGTALTYAEEKQEEAEEEMRKRIAAQNQGMIRPYTFDYGMTNISGEPYTGSAERTYFQPTYTAGTPYKAPGPEYAADGGLMGYAAGGPIEQMADMNAVGMNTGYPMANLQTPMYSNPGMQRPEATNVIAPSADAGVGAYSGEQRFRSGGATKEPQSSGYTYDYDPKSMMFTQTGGPGVSGGLGGFGRGIITGPESFALTSKQYDAAMAAKNAQQATPNGTVSGGIATPMMQPAAPMQSFAPTTTVPAYQTPEQQLGLGGFYDYMNQQMGGYGGYAAGGNVGGGISHLGDYSDGGRLLKGPGDGVSDSIPASIGNRQPARLADGEFVVPARIVSEIGNGSTEAGARKLYAMMDRVQRARRKTTGKNQVAANTKAERLLPA